jgi:type IV secretory pathway TraG/TraD family ATPase VirD4
MTWFRRKSERDTREGNEDPSEVDDSLRWGPLLLDSDEATHHFAVIGATGSGKTTILRLLMQDVITSIRPGRDARALVYDAKQDAFSTLHGMAPNVRIVTLNPFDARGAAWDMARDVQEPRVAVEIAFTLIPREHESQPFFSDAARHLIYGVMVSFMFRQLDWTFADLVRAVSSPGKLQRILAVCPHTKSLLPRYFQDKRLLANILSTIATKMLAFEAVAACWESASERISLEDWIGQEFVLVLGNSETSRHAIDALNRCIVKRACDLILNQSESWTRRTWIQFDELSEAGKLDGLVALAKKGRSKGACIALAFQSIAGLRDARLYGPQLTAEILGQIGHRCIGRLECPETAEWASQLFGDQEIRQVTINNTYGRENTTSHNEQFVTRRAILPSEFMSLTPCDAVHGLSAFYLSRVTGAFSATLDGEELFDGDLIPKADDVPDFLPRAVASQYLRNWTREEALRFAPAGTGHKNRRPRRRKTRSHENLRILDELDDV